MSGGDDDQDQSDKEHDPSQKKLDDARQQGDIARSTDLLVAASYGAFLAVCMGFGAQALMRAGSAGAVMLDQADRMSSALSAGARAPLGGIMTAMVAPLLPLILVPMAAVLFVLFVTRGFVFAPEKLMPKWSRVSPMATAGQKFGRTGLIEFLKSFFKLVVMAVLLGFFLTSRADRILATHALPAAMGMAELLRLMVEFLILVVLVAGVFGVVDFLWQQFEFKRRNRMSRKDLTDEAKESEGDPHMKGTRRQRAREVAMNRMLVDVATADVVVVNPTHYAVALKWSRKKKGAPVCVAKGVDEIAARIRERAAAAGIPLHSDPPTARALHASVEIGQEIRPEHYRAVAAAIRFAESMRKRARASRVSE
jgi:flagellar biosynthesis protein FlhB